MTPQPPPHLRYRRTKLVLSTLALVLGLATVIVTLTADGGSVTSRGVLLGLILMLLAGTRLTLTLRGDI